MLCLVRCSPLGLHTLMWVFPNLPGHWFSSSVTSSTELHQVSRRGRRCVLERLQRARGGFKSHFVNLCSTSLPASTRYPNTAASCTSKGWGCTENITFLSGDKWYLRFLVPILNWRHAAPAQRGLWKERRETVHLAGMNCSSIDFDLLQRGNFWDEWDFILYLMVHSFEVWFGIAFPKIGK